MIIICLILIFVLSVLDYSASTFFFLCVIYFLGMVYSLTIPKEYKEYRVRLFNGVFLVYIVSALVVSVSFSISDYYLVSDSSRYIENYMQRTQMFFNGEDLYKCYFEFSDSNLLYNAYLNVMAVFANTKLDGMTVFGMTLLQTVWGILSSIVLFRILARHIEVDKAFRYTLIFSLCSLFLFYSTVIIRDIIICFLYLCAFDIVDRKFSLLGVLKLLILVMLAWGIRLYSGIFMVAFLGYYVYVRFRNSQLKSVATILFAAVIISAGVGLMASSLMEQTTAELQGYEELSAERSAGGIVSKLQSLPPGISHLAIVLFTMIRPLPPLGIYIGAETFSHFMMSSMCLIAGFFWFVVFYSLCYKLFVQKYIYKISFETVVLLIVCLVFLLANASHPDIRRMLPVFPVLFTQYAILCEHENETLFGWKIPKLLMTIYVALAIGLLIVM